MLHIRGDMEVLNSEIIVETLSYFLFGMLHTVHHIVLSYDCDQIRVRDSEGGELGLGIVG